MIVSPGRDLTLAFAGVFQSSELVRQLARQDHFDHGALRESANSLLRTDAVSTEDVFGSRFGVELGLRTLVRILGGRPRAEDRDLYQYMVCMHQLSLQLHRLDKTSRLIHDELEQIAGRFGAGEDVGDDADGHVGDDTGDDAGQLYESLAGLYSRTISYLTPRIIVQGSAERLQDGGVANRVRTALFAGIRAAYLWRQLGGRKWQLLFNRKGYVSTARGLLSA